VSGTLVLGHDACGQLVRVEVAALRGLAVWGDAGDYLSKLAAQLVRQGWGVTYVGPTSRHRLLASVQAADQQATPASVWLTTAKVEAWLRTRQVVTLEPRNAEWLGDLLAYHQQAARKLMTGGEYRQHALVLDCHPDLYLQTPLLGLLQSGCLLPLVSLRGAGLCGQPPPDGVLGLVFRSSGSTELAQQVLHGERSAEDVARLRWGWGYLAAPGAVVQAVNGSAALHHSCIILPTT